MRTLIIMFSFFYKNNILFIHFYKKVTIFVVYINYYITIAKNLKNYEQLFKVFRRVRKITKNKRKHWQEL